MIKMVVSTNNSHKVEEFKELLNFSEFNILQPKDFDEFPDIEETGTTFEENAAIKAVEASKYTNLCAFADDSGLEVDALDGRPGIYSARYGGENASAEEKNAKLLNELLDEENRAARFICVIAIAKDGKLLSTFRGEVEGEIIKNSKGAAGFGYDPIFQPNGYSKTFSELGSDIKSTISHRAKAMQQFKEYLKKEVNNLI